MDAIETDEEPWYSLDNAGKVFPSILSARATTVFRVYLRRGFFWYYLQGTNDIPSVLPDSRYPCEKILMKKGGVFLLRVRVFGKRIALECSHALTDGYGALTFLKALLAEYLDILHGPLDDLGSLPRPGQTPDPEEAEDAFVRYYDHSAPAPRVPGKAFKLSEKRLHAGRYLVVTGAMSVAKLKEVARAKGGASINDLLVAVFLDVLQELAFLGPRGRLRPIRLVVPLDLRRILPSKTLRNFSLYVMPEIDPRLGRYEFDELLAHVHHFMRMTANEKSIHADLARNVKAEKTLLIRLLPLPVKNILFNAFLSALGENAITSSISNLGAVSLPDSMIDHVSSLDFLPAPGKQTRLNCGVVSLGDELHVSFGRVVANPETERLFFTKLVKLGVPVRMEA